MTTDERALSRALNRAERERRARKQAEELLERKSTELWEANQELARARDELEHRVVARTADLERALESANDANEAKSKFLAHMSHELRTPLTAIIGNASDLREAGDSAELETIERNGRHLLSLINEILDLAKIESGTFHVQPRATHAHELLQDLESTFRPRASAKGLDFLVTIDPSVPDHCVLDPLRVKQIVLNLVANAINYTARGNVMLSAHAQHSREGALLIIRVADSGPGIPESAQATLFEAFTQVERRRGTVSGTGLGLAIAANLAEAMDGRLDLESRAGIGSCFQLTLPLIEVLPVLPAPSAPERKAPGLHGLKVLLVDDAPDNRLLLSRWIARAGAQVETANDGKQALTAVDSDTNIVLMDVQMPVMDGVQATKELRRRGCTLPIVALTADQMSTDESARVAAGFDGFVPKPVNKLDLLEAIAKLAEWRSNDRRQPA